MNAVPSFLTLEEASSTDVQRLLARAKELKSRRPHPVPDGAFVGFLSDRSSVRTRLAVHQAAELLGKRAIDFDFATSFYADPARRGDHARFIAAELASMRELGCSALVVRTDRHATLLAWRELTAIPLVNGCSDEEHPLQALADAFVLSEYFGRADGLRLTLVGNGLSPVFRSLLFLSAHLGIDLVLACPSGYEFPPALVERAGMEGRSMHTQNVEEALSRADVVYLDSVVYRALTPAEEEAFEPYRLTASLIQRHGADARIMHCLPHADEIDAELIFRPQSLVFQQVAARVPVTAAALEMLAARASDSARSW